MAKMLYSVSMSLDGFITRPGGDMSWLTEYLGPNPAAEALIPQIGALLIGRNTFGGDDPHKGTEAEGKPFGGGWEGPQFVLTHHPAETSVPGVSFVGDIDTAIASAKAAAGDKYVNVLGATTAREVLNAGALDEVFVCVAPVMLGDGVPLFDRPGGQTVPLERISVSHAPLAVNLHFRVKR